MTFFGVLMIGVMAFGPPLCLVKPWRYEEMMELWNAPPPPPVASDKAFVALGLRYGYLAWRCLVAFLLTTLSAVTALSLTETYRLDEANGITTWMGDSFFYLWMMLTVLWVAFWVKVGITIWRITRADKKRFRKRTLVRDCIAPGFFLGVVSWAFLAGAGPGLVNLMSAT